MTIEELRKLRDEICFGKKEKDPETYRRYTRDIRIVYQYNVREYFGEKKEDGVKYTISYRYFPEIKEWGYNLMRSSEIKESPESIILFPEKEEFEMFKELIEY